MKSLAVIMAYLTGLFVGGVLIEHREEAWARAMALAISAAVWFFGTRLEHLWDRGK